MDGQFFPQVLLSLATFVCVSMALVQFVAILINLLTIPNEPFAGRRLWDCIQRLTSSILEDGATTIYAGESVEVDLPSLFAAQASEAAVNDAQVSSVLRMSLLCCSC